MTEPIEGLSATTNASQQEHLHIDCSTIDTISTLARAASAVQEHMGTHHVLVPENHKLTDITDLVEKAQPEPNRKRGTVTLLDLDSFTEYVAAHSTETSTMVYADPDKRTLTAVFNDHSYPADPLPGWRDFRATYTAELSREFATWIAMNKNPMEQEQFAIFLEDNIADVCEPGGDTLLSVALTLQAKTEVSFSSSKRLENGQVQFLYTENIDARAGNGSIEIPREFTIGVRLFKGGEGYKVRARLKYRLNGGNLKFWYELDRHETAIEDAFDTIVARAADTGVTVLMGRQ